MAIKNPTSYLRTGWQRLWFVLLLVYLSSVVVFTGSIFFSSREDSAVLADLHKSSCTTFIHVIKEGSAPRPAKPVNGQLHILKAPDGSRWIATTETKLDQQDVFDRVVKAVSENANDADFDRKELVIGPAHLIATGVPVGITDKQLLERLVRNDGSIPAPGENDTCKLLVDYWRSSHYAVLTPREYSDKLIAERNAATLQTFGKWAGLGALAFCALYLLGLAVGWVRSGFKNQRH